MVYKGRVKNGVVVIEGDAKPPEGMEVEILAPSETEKRAGEEIPSIYERYKNVIGIFDDLPPDFAEQHDHYIHGTPKR